MQGILPLFEQKKFLLLDGGFATQLEANGFNISNYLWSINPVRDDPEAVKKVHQQFVKAGADISITGSYKAAPQVFMRGLGISYEEAELLTEEMTIKSAELACEVRDQMYKQ